MQDPRLDRLAQLVVAYSLELRPGEQIALVGPEVAAPLIEALEREAIQAGAIPSVFIESLVDGRPVRDPEFAHLLASRSRTLACVFLEAGIGLRQARSTGDASLVSRFMQQSVQGSLRWIVVPFPCDLDARRAGMTMQEWTDFVFRACLVDRGDAAERWRELARAQDRLCDYLRRIRSLRFQTAAGTDLTVAVEGRHWINGNGQSNLPDGEVYSSPREGSAEGLVVVDVPAMYGGELIEDVRLRFRCGQVSDANARRGEQLLHRLLSCDPGASRIGEIAFGCNYAISHSSRNTLFDEKMGGTFHLALGASYPDSGGLNQSSLHWDLVCDLRRGGMILADGRPVSVNGRFRHPLWPR